MLSMCVRNNFCCSELYSVLQKSSLASDEMCAIANNSGTAYCLFHI